MMKLLGICIGLGWVTAVVGSDSHVGSPNPEAEEAMEEAYGDPSGISLPEVQVVRFLGQHFPEMLAELEEAEAKGPEERADVLDRARGIILEWEEHQRVGDEAAESFIGVERLHYQNDGLVSKYVKMEEGPEKEAAGLKLRANLKEIHTMRIRMEKAELARLKEEIAIIEENLEYSGTNQATMVETELRDLLEFWRLEQAGQTADRKRERPLMPATPPLPVIPGTPIIPEEVAPEKTGTDSEGTERVEIARPVEDEGEGGGFVERETGEETEAVKPKVVEESEGE